MIGARTASLLLSAGHRVVGVDNLNDYYDVRLKQHRLAALEAHGGDFVFHEIDIESLDAVKSVFAAHPGLVAVINLAARAGVRYSMENPFVYLSTNVTGTLNLLEAMRMHSVKKIVVASTSSLYAGQVPPFSEELPVNTPISPYAATKKAAEAMAYTYHHLYQMDVSILRYFTVYGPAGRPDMSPYRFIKWIAEGTPITVFGDGTQTRDFTYVDDIASGTIAALKPLGYEVINLGGGRRPYSLLEMIKIIETELGLKAKLEFKPFHKADMADTAADITKAAKLLDWRPETDLPEGLQRTIAWYKANQELVRAIAV